MREGGGKFRVGRGQLSGQLNCVATAGYMPLHYLRVFDAGWHPMGSHQPSLPHRPFPAHPLFTEHPHFPSKSPQSHPPMSSTGITGKSSGRTMWVSPKVCHTTTSDSATRRFCGRVGVQS